MTRILFAASAAMVIAAVLVVRTAPVSILEEPRHKRVLYTAHVRLFEIAIPPRDTTLEHAHDYDIATVALETSSSRARVGTGAWSEPRERTAGSLNLTEYTGKPSSHQIQTTAQAPYRLVAVENVRDGGWTSPPALSEPGTTLIQESRAFSIYEVRLDGQTPETTHTHAVPTVAVLVSGEFAYQGGGGSEPFAVRQAGRWIYALPGGEHTMRVADGAQARIIEFEAR